MAITLYEYTKSVNISTLEAQINTTTNITVGLSSLALGGTDQLKIWMKAELSQDEELALDDLVAAHVATPAITSDVCEFQMNEAPIYATDIDNSYFKQTFAFNTGTDLNPTPLSISWPYAIAILGGKLVTKDTWATDKFKVEIAPNILVGQTVSAVASGTKLVQVNADCALYYVWKSEIITLTDGNTININMGRLLSKNGSMLSMENAAPADLPPGMGVLVNTQVVPEYEICGAEEVIIGRKTARGMYIPANIPMVITYTNTTLQDKRVIFSLEWYA